MYWRTRGRDKHVPDKSNRFPKVGSEVAASGMSASVMERKRVGKASIDKVVSILGRVVTSISS